jgi:dsDNA-binding SOS-regulon protein
MKRTNHKEVDEYVHFLSRTDLRAEGLAISALEHFDASGIFDRPNPGADVSREEEKFMNWMKWKKQEAPAQARPSRYYEADGALRAYANRSMVLAFASAATAMIAVIFAAWVRLQPAMVIRVDQNGNAAVVGRQGTANAAAPGAKADADDFERQAAVKGFLDRYLNFSPETVNRNWAEALNMMTANLRRTTLSVMEKENSAGGVQDDQITSVFHLRSIEAAADDPLVFTAFGMKEVHRVHEHSESTEKLVGEYRIRLISERRSADNPSGLLIAEYGEKLITGEKADALAQDAAFNPGKSKN